MHPFLRFEAHGLDFFTMNILFVCTGNVSRSFLAETLMREEIRARKLNDVSVASAGVHAYPGSPPDPLIVEYLEGKGIPVQRHEARQMTAQEAEWADLILVMENLHVRMIEESWPEVKDKVALLLKYTAVAPGVEEIIDPYGRTTYHYRLAEAQIDLAVRALGNSLSAPDH